MASKTVVVIGGIDLVRGAGRGDVGDRGSRWGDN